MEDVMKKIKNGKDYWMILGRGVLAGVMISIGGTINLMMDNKIIGAFLFSIGLFMICANGFNLYTGKIGYVIDNKPKYLIELLLTIIGNLLGTVGCGYLLRCSRISSTISAKAISICQIKLDDNLLSIFILSVFCGILMYLAVDLFKKLNDGGKYIAVFICVTVFILCGFEHCVANMYYFSAANMWSMKTIYYVLMMILGNSVGSILLALGNKYCIKKS